MNGEVIDFYLLQGDNECGTAIFSSKVTGDLLFRSK